MEKMHPRNIYLYKKPDFAELARKYTFLTPYVSVVRNKGYLDFRNVNALLALNRALLLNDFDLDVIIPHKALVPVIPQRLNYILWIEDIFKPCSEQLYGLDIGTGGTAIYALLGARKNNWKMLGTDIAEDSVHFATKNVERNGLQDLVTVQLTHETAAGDFFSEISGKFHFSMCNPPFFSSEEESDSLSKSRKPDRPSPSGTKTGTSNELVARGGELGFLSKMITESRKYLSTVGIFTTMVGIKADMRCLKEILKASQVLAYTTTKFVQGKTMRWGLAWTFDSRYASFLSSAQKSRPAAPVQITLSCTCSHLDFVAKIKSILSELEFRFLVNTADFIEVVGETNTWTNQRRKRRAERRKQVSPDEEELKRVKCDTSTATSPNGEFSSANLRDYEGKDFPLRFQMNFGEEKDLTVMYLDGNMGIDGVHQVLQYLKNVYNRQHTCSSIS